MARPVPWAERIATKKASDACEAEWKKLREAIPPDAKEGEVGCWLESDMREFEDVQAEANCLGVLYHFGSLMELCFEKNPELDKNDPLRKFKGRVVFRGDQVRDQNHDVALFQEMSSSPATMGASKVGDFMGSFLGTSCRWQTQNPRTRRCA